MKLVVCNDWWSDKQAHYLNKDGFLRALGVLRDEYGWETKFIKFADDPGSFNHEYIRYEYSTNVKEAVLSEEPDAILVFGDLSRPLLGELRDCGIPVALAFTGGLFDQYEDVPKVIFVESKVYYDRFKSHGRNVVRAFGTNTDIFHPTPQPKLFDACYPSTMALWKRSHLFAEALGSKGIACGWFQPHEPQVWEEYQKHGVFLLHHQNAESVNLIYNASKTCVVTAGSDGGCQRTVLEAMACGIPVVAMNDSDKTTEYVLESGFGRIVAPQPSAILAAVQDLIVEAPNPQVGIDYINSKYTQHHYAKALKEGIEGIL